MYFPDRGCVHTLLTLYVYATVDDNDDGLTWNFHTAACIHVALCQADSRCLCQRLSVCCSVSRITQNVTGGGFG